MKDYINKTVNAGYVVALKALEETLNKEGFKIISEINIHDRLKEEFQIDFRKITILGTRHPDFISASSDPDSEENASKVQCNFVVHQLSENETEVGCYNPVALNGNSGNSLWKETEIQITQKLGDVIRQMINDN